MMTTAVAPLAPVTTVLPTLRPTLAHFVGRATKLVGRRDGRHAQRSHERGDGENYRSNPATDCRSDEVHDAIL
jgi:hypothetical protein